MERAKESGYLSGFRVKGKNKDGVGVSYLLFVLIRILKIGWFANVN